MTMQHNFPVGTQLDTTLFGKVTVIPETEASSFSGGIAVSTSHDGAKAYVFPNEVTSVLTSITPEPEVASAEAFNVAVAKVAAEFNRLIGFYYVKPDGEHSDRVLEVEHVIEGSKGTLIVGRDTEADDWRAFRADRIDGEVELY